MKKQKNPKTDSEILRQKAEGLLKKKLLKTPVQNSDFENIKLLHELRIYQSELESQNEELMLSKEMAATAMRKYSELFDYAPLGYLALSKTGEIIEINQLGSLLLGKERKDLVNSRFGFFISNDTKPVFNQFLEKIFSNKTTESCKVTISIPDKIEYVILTGHTIHNGEQCLVAVADITQSRITEIALEQESAQRHILFEQSPDGILIIDPVTAQILDFNNAAHEQLGYSREEFAQLSIHDVEVMESNEETHIRISEVMRDGKAEFETLQQTKKGEIRNVSVKAQIIQINGDPVYYCIWRDITKQKQVQLALRESENRYRTMFENCLTGIMITHPDGSINAANPEACRLLGRSEADICKVGRDGVMNLNDPRLAMALSERQRSGRFHGELSMIHKDGTIFPADIVSSSFTDSEGQLLANIIFRDITSRRRIEVALRESEANLNAVFNATDEAIFLFTVDEILMALNESAVQRMGRPREELIGRRLNDMLPEDVIARHRPFISHALLTGERVKFDDERHGCWTANNLYPIPGDTNKIERLAIFSRDITEQIQASEALRLSEERQRFILDSLPVAIFTSPVNSEIDTSWISGNVKSITGFEAAEYISENDFWRKRIHPEDREHILNAYANLSGRAENLPEYRWKCSDGVYHWFQDRSILLENEYRKEFLGVIIDITERKTAEIILKESEVKFRSLVETTNDVIWETNKEGLYTYLSPQIKDVLGYEWQELVGHSPFEHMPDDESDVIRKRSDDIIASGKSFNGLINVNLHKDGRRIILETSGVPKFDSNNNYIGYRGIDRDITDRKRAEEEINLLNTVLEQRVKQRTIELENANKELDAFAYSVSHNLRSPLRGIDGWSMALLEDYNHLLDEQGRTYLGRVRNEAQQMASLIDDLLKLARVSRVERLQNDVDISGLVQIISNQFILANPKRMFEFIIEPGLAVSGDLSMLQIVLTNLLDNACKFTGQNPVAHIEFGKQLIKGKAVFFIRDNGVGFNMEKSKNLFGAFQKMHKPSEYPGSGIGLATVHRIITRHGGRIWAESKPGEGAVFYFTIS